MANELRIPKLGMTVTEVTLTEWMFGDGEEVAVGDILYTVETDKSTTEVEAQDAGVLRIHAEDGAVLKIGDLVGVIE